MNLTPDAGTPVSLANIPATKVVVAEHLGKQTPDGSLTLLDDLSFAVTAGESVAICGRSGSGKSTLLSLLAGLDSATSGRCWLAGARLDLMNEDARAALRAGRVGFVFQSFQLLPAMTALENVMLPLEIAGMVNARERAHDWLARVGLAARERHYPRQLSGGEQQRVAIARAFAPEPSILFADEPTGNLDTRTGAQVAELLFAANLDAGTTLLLVTHDDQLAARCSRLLRLEAGRLVADSAA